MTNEAKSGPRLKGAGLVAIGAVAAVVVGVWLYSELDRGDATGAEVTSPPQSREEASAPATLGGLYSWPDGTVLLFGVKARHTTSIAYAEGDQAAPPIEGELQVDLQVRLTALRTFDGVTTFQLAYPRVDSLAWKVLGKELPEDKTRPMVARATAMVQIDANGNVRALKFAPTTDAPVASLTRSLLYQTQAVISAGEREWTSSYDDSATRMSATHHISSCDDAACTISVTRGGDALSAEKGLLTFVPGDFAFERATVKVDHTLKVQPDGGRLLAMEAHNSVVAHKEGAQVAATSFNGELTLISTHTADVTGMLAALASYVDGDALDKDQRTGGLEGRVAGLTFEQAMADLLGHGVGGQMPDHKRWLWRLTGLIHLDPETAKRLEGLFFDPRLHDNAKAIILEVLASAGSGPAQVAMRNILGADDTRKDPNYHAYIQRFILLGAPEPETVAFLDETWRTSDGPARYGAVNALGSALARSKHRDPQAAERLADSIHDGLEGEDDPDARRAFISALGNTGLPSQDEHIIAHTNDPHTGVRTEATAALARIKTPAATTALGRIATSDPEASVQRTATRALSKHTPTPEHVASLTAGVESGSFKSANAQILVNTVETWLGEGVEPSLLAPLLEALLRNPQMDKRARHRASAVLERIKG